jgi:dihydroflavonol-4-reductase
MIMKVFITGGTGFIGKQLVRRMAETKHEMYCLARKTSDTAEMEKLGAKIVFGDVQDKDSLLKGMHGCDWLFNLANLYSLWEPEKSAYRKVNVIGTLNVMECALQAGLSKVVHVSSVAVYGKPLDSPFSEKSAVGPVRFSQYAQTKYEGDLIAWKMFKENKLPLVVIFPAIVLGSEDVSLAGQSIGRLISRRLPARSFNRKTATYVHVNDVAEAILKAAEKAGNIGEKYILGDSRLSFDEFYNLISELSGVRKPLMVVPDWLTMISAGFLTFLSDITKLPPLMGLAADAMRTSNAGFKADGSKAARELGIAYTPIRKAIEDEIAWYRNNSRSR